MKNPKVGERCRKRYESGTFIDVDILEVHGDGVTVQWDRDKVKCPTYKTKHHRTHLIRLKPKRKPEVFEGEVKIGRGMPDGWREFSEKHTNKKVRIRIEVLE